METFLGDTVKISLEVGIDVSAYPILKIKYKKPNGVSGYWTATLDPTDDSVIYYICDSSDLDINGNWRIQAYVESLVAKGHGRIVDLKVFEPVDYTIVTTTMIPTTSVP